MLVKVIGISAIAIIGVGVWGARPLVSNPDPATQTELVRRDFDASGIHAVWQGAGPDDRIRARIVLQGEQVIFEDGPIDMIMNTASMRKSYLSLLYGIAIDQGLIDPTKTLAELGIDETPALTDQEKTATILDLLKFRSGIFIPAEGEHDSQITHRPERGSVKPGEAFESNNFDANALGTIFIQETGYEIGAFMDEFLAQPLGMQDFNADNVVMGVPWFMPTYGSQHPMYNMYLSARDIARIGAMVAQGGVWNGVQVVPADWIAASITMHSDLSHLDYGQSGIDGFGYIWWLISDKGMVRTDGYGEHLMLISPEHDLTVVERNFSGNSYLSTGLWMLKPDNWRSSDFVGAGKAFDVIVAGIKAAE